MLTCHTFVPLLPHRNVLLLRHNIMVKISFVNILFDKIFQNELIFMLKFINMFLGVKLLFDKWQFSSNTQKTDTISNIKKYLSIFQKFSFMKRLVQT